MAAESKGHRSDGTKTARQELPNLARFGLDGQSVTINRRLAKLFCSESERRRELARFFACRLELSLERLPDRTPRFGADGFGKSLDGELCIER